MRLLQWNDPSADWLDEVCLIEGRFLISSTRRKVEGVKGAKELTKDERRSNSWKGAAFH